MLHSLVEIGIFTGYTVLTIALALLSDGHLIASDINDTDIRHDLWKKAGVQEKIRVNVGSAVNPYRNYW